MLYPLVIILITSHLTYKIINSKLLLLLLNIFITANNNEINRTQSIVVNCFPSTIIY